MEEEINNQEINPNWRVDKIEISFQYGFSHKENPDERVDRYEGIIRFENGDRESFQFKIKPNMADKYIDLISDEIVKSATELGEKLKKSLNLE